MSALAAPTLVNRLQSDTSFLRSFVSNPAAAVVSTGAEATGTNAMLVASTPRELHGASLEAAQSGPIAQPTSTAMTGVMTRTHGGPQTGVHLTSSALEPHGGQFYPTSTAQPTNQVPVSSALPGEHGPVSSAMPPEHGGPVSSALQPMPVTQGPLSSVFQPTATAVSSMHPAA